MLIIYIIITTTTWNRCDTELQRSGEMSVQLRASSEWEEINNGWGSVIRCQSGSSRFKNYWEDKKTNLKWIISPFGSEKGRKWRSDNEIQSALKIKTLLPLNKSEIKTAHSLSNWRKKEIVSLQNWTTRFARWTQIQRVFLGCLEGWLWSCSTTACCSWLQR